MAASSENDYTFCVQTQIPPGPSAQRGRGFNMGCVATDVKNGPPSRIAYGQRRQVIIREVDDHTHAFHYRGHTGDVTCARWAPAAANDKGGGYIMTGDDQGNWRVWTCREKGPVTKGPVDDEGFKCGKAIRDVAWQGDNRKCCIVGEGDEEKGKCASWDSGNQFGIFNQATRNLLSVDTTMQRPYRAVCTGESGYIYLYKSVGGNYENMGILRDFKKFMNCVRVHPCGEWGIAAGAGGKFIYMFNMRKPFTMLKKLPINSTSSVYGMSFSPDGEKVVLVGANKAITIYEISAPFQKKEEKIKKKTITTYEFDIENIICKEIAVYDCGKEVADQQVACAFTSQFIVSSSLMGDLTFLNHEGEFVKQVSGHDNAVTSMAVVPGDDPIIYSMSRNRVIRTCLSDKSSRRYRSNHGVHMGNPIAYKFIGLSAKNDVLVTVANNDTVIRTPVESLAINKEGAQPTGGACRWLCCGNSNNDLVVLWGVKEGIKVFHGEKCVSTTKVDYYSNSACLHPDDSILFVSAQTDERSDNKKPFFVVYKVNEDGTLVEERRTESNPGITGPIKKCCLKPDDPNQMAVLYGSNTRCIVLDMKTNETSTNSSINCLGEGFLRDISWRPDAKATILGVGTSSQIALMSSLSSEISLKATMESLDHPHLQDVNICGWLSHDSLITGGSTGALKIWKLMKPWSETKN